MKKFFTSFFLTAILTLSASLFACKPQEDNSMYFSCFNTVVYIQTDDKPLSQSTKNSLEDNFKALDDLFSISKQSSFTSSFNQLSVGQSITVDDTVAQIIKECQQLESFTNGKFNPAIKKLLRLWKFDETFSVTQTFSPPSPQEIDNVLNGKIDFDKLVLDEQSNTVYKQGDIEVDFGGIVKGYATDQALEILKNAGHTKGHVNIGGSSLAILSSESLGIRHPRKVQDLCLTVKLRSNDLLVSTSGDYERSYFDGQGNRYSHIIDPNTGRPADTGIASATIICKDGTFADALTTSLCTLSHTPNDANSELVLMMKKILQQHADAQLYVFYIKDDVKQLITNKKQGEDFTLHDTAFTVFNFND